MFLVVVVKLLFMVFVILRFYWIYCMFICFFSSCVFLRFFTFLLLISNGVHCFALCLLHFLFVLYGSLNCFLCFCFEIVLQDVWRFFVVIGFCNRFCIVFVFRARLFFFSRCCLNCVFVMTFIYFVLLC